jgi:YHS domain-containing protein
MKISRFLNKFILNNAYIYLYQGLSYGFVSPRNMQEYIQDAMTYVRHYGRPDLFITFTWNLAQQI